MAKGSGGTRSGSSGNPRGVGNNYTASSGEKYVVNALKRLHNNVSSPGYDGRQQETINIDGKQMTIRAMNHVTSGGEISAKFSDDPLIGLKYSWGDGYAFNDFDGAYSYLKDNLKEYISRYTK